MTNADIDKAVKGVINGAFFPVLGSVILIAGKGVGGLVGVRVGRAAGTNTVHKGVGTGSGNRIALFDNFADFALLVILMAGSSTGRSNGSACKYRVLVGTGIVARRAVAVSIKRMLLPVQLLSAAFNSAFIPVILGARCKSGGWHTRMSTCSERLEGNCGNQQNCHQQKAE